MQWFLDNLQENGEKTAIVDSGGEYSYVGLYDQCMAFNRELGDSISDGETVAILGDYSFYSISLMLSLLYRSCVIVPIVSTNDTEVQARLDECQCDRIITLEDGKPTVANHTGGEKHDIVLALQEKQHAGLILFSSGSTGKPKAMIHDLNVLLDSYQGRKKKNLAIMVFLMFDHIGGVNTLLNSLAMGAKIIFPGSRKVDDVCRLIQEHGVNILPTSPTFLNLMLIGGAFGKYNLKSLKMITYGTEPMPESLLSKLREVLPKTKLLQTFGTSETGIAQTSSRSSTSLEMKIDQTSQEYKIVDGELWLRSKTQILGYLNHDMDSFTDDGWFKTGDLAEESGDGYLRIKGRKKEMINVGGEKVLPIEVESILMEIAEVQDAIVYGATNAITGQSVNADVVVESDLSPREIKRLIRRYASEKLAAYKVPAKINIMEAAQHSARFKKMRLNKDN